MTKNARIQLFTLILGIILFAGKLVAYQLTRSNLILTDALESIVNIVAAGLGLYSLILASKPKDENHPYGHGKIEFISASVEGILITLAGLGIILKSILSFFEPSELQDLETGIWIIALAGGLNFIAGFLIEQQGKRTSSLTLAAGGKHLKSDAYSTLGMLVGLLLIYLTGIRELDYAAAILFGIFIFYTGIRILRKSISGIMDETDYKLVSKIVAVLKNNRANSWVDIHNMRVIKYGSTLHIDCHLTLPYYLDLIQGHAEIDRIENLISSHFDNSVEVFIHTDPCVESSCAICLLADCPVRKHPFQQEIDWNLPNLVKNHKHGIE